MGSFSTSLSGVEAASQDLSVISNNLANLDTTAYKDQEANFQDFFYQMLGTNGAGDPTQIGAGTVIGSVISAFTQGTINSTGVPTDMAIQGGGFFLEQNGAATLYTRAGNFSQNATGYLVTSDGGYVLGYPAVNGVISPSQTLAPLQISSGQISPPNATTNVELSMNLDASATAASSTAATAATGVLTVTGNATANETVTIGGTTYTFVSALSTSPHRGRSGSYRLNLGGQHACQPGRSYQRWLRRRHNLQHRNDGQCFSDCNCGYNNFDLNGVPARERRQQHRYNINLWLIWRRPR